MEVSPALPTAEEARPSGGNKRERPLGQRPAIKPEIPLPPPPRSAYGLPESPAIPGIGSAQPMLEGHYGPVIFRRDNSGSGSGRRMSPFLSSGA